MAASTAVARRYTEALFAAARDAGRIDAVEQDLATLEQITQQSPRVLEVIGNPLVPADRKLQILDRIFSDSVEPITLRLLHLLVEKRRSDVLPYLRGLYTEMANEYRGLLPAYVHSAIPLTTEEERALAARLAALTGKKIQLHSEVRPELIGGVLVHVGDTVIDGSVTGYLRQLRRRLKDALV
ncbi:MAG: ATP synthase F1 subunit delta [Armatimonadetes bacterium]|nr:ATP synthase F1 subunit delta [Armatimonadota bacterium]